MKEMIVVIVAMVIALGILILFFFKYVEIDGKYCLQQQELARVKSQAKYYMFLYLNKRGIDDYYYSDEVSEYQIYPDFQVGKEYTFGLKNITGYHQAKVEVITEYAVKLNKTFSYHSSGTFGFPNSTEWFRIQDFYDVLSIPEKDKGIWETIIKVKGEWKDGDAK